MNEFTISNNTEYTLVINVHTIKHEGVIHKCTCNMYNSISDIIDTEIFYFNSTDIITDTGYQGSSGNDKYNDINKLYK